MTHTCGPTVTDRDRAARAAARWAAAVTGDLALRDDLLGRDVDEWLTVLLWRPPSLQPAPDGIRTAPDLTSFMQAHQALKDLARAMADDPPQTVRQLVHLARLAAGRDTAATLVADLDPATAGMGDVVDLLDVADAIGH